MKWHLPQDDSERLATWPRRDFKSVAKRRGMRW